MSQNVLTCGLCGAKGGTRSVTHVKPCKYEDHITYKKENGTPIILRIKNKSESETIIEYNNQERQLKMEVKLKL